MKQKRPNFLFIIADQWRYDWLGCAGNAVLQTPHLDRLAAEGIRLDRCYTVQPMCMATRATLFTGLTPRAHGVRCNGIPLRTDIPTVPQVLAENGYRTHGIGKIHLNPWFPQKDFTIDQLKAEDWPEARPVWTQGKMDKLPQPYYGLQSVDFLAGVGQGSYGDYLKWLLQKEPKALELMGPPDGIEMNFERAVEVAWESRLPEELHTTAWAAECTESFLKAQTSQKTPFFLWLSIPDPHPPYTAPPPWSRIYQPADMPMPIRRQGELDELPPHYKKIYQDGLFTAGRIAATKVSDQRHREVLAMAYGMISQFDDMVGKVIDSLQRYHFLDNTVICFMSDHGQMMGDHWMYSMPPCHMDGSVRVPCIWKIPNQFPRGFTSQELVSLLDFAPTVLDLAGVEIPEGPKPPVPEAANQNPAWPGESIRPLLTGRRRPVHDSVIVEFDSDYTGLRLRTLITREYHITLYVNRPFGELYDLRSDPNQLYNLWSNPQYTGVRQTMLIALLHRLVQTDSNLPRRMGHA